MSYPPQPPQPPQGQPGPMYGGVAPTNQKAIWSLVTGILGFVCIGLLGGIPAIILGRQAKQEIQMSGGAEQGYGMAQAGFILGIIATVWSVLGLIIWIVAIVIGVAAGSH